MMTENRLRELYGQPNPRAAKKVIHSLDRNCREFIANSTFLILATTDGKSLDVSPKGDPAGFVAVQDDKHLLLPDRPGNNRIDGLINLCHNSSVALIFMIPAVNETLRVNGTADILDTPELLNSFIIKNRAPKTVLRITVDEIFSHCGKAPIRAGLWQPETWPQQRPIATLNEIVRDHADMDVGPVDQNTVDDLYRKTLY